MRASSLSRPATAVVVSALLSSWQLPTANAFTATPVSQPNLDLSLLGRVALTEQTEAAPSTNDSQALLTTLPNGDLVPLLSADADILAMCSWTRKDGSFEGIVVGGNFTSLGGTKAEGIALYDPASNNVRNMSGLSGVVQALLCDQESDSVYVGGDYSVGNSTNAMIWNGTGGWKALPFNGFNGPISSIVKNSEGHIIFGGKFESLGNVSTSTATNSSQVVNLSAANITSDAQTSLAGFVDPRNIICKSDAAEGPGNTWLLDDYSPGFWQAQMGFTFYPSKVRLYNTHFQGRGTQSFRFQALPDTGIMNLTYTDPSTGQKAFCDFACPLSNDTSEPFRDFELVNPVGMSGFMIQILNWYGQGAGLDGIEIFQSQVFTYALNDFNEPACTGIEFPATSSTTGDWTVTSAGAPSDYLIANASQSDVSITFKPDIKQSGNYSVLLYTPGCSDAGTCQSRGIVNITATFTSTEPEANLDTSIIYQTNNFEKYDTIYTGFIEASSDKFRSQITVTPVAGQGDIEIVASRVGFHLLNSTGGGLNGLYDYDPSNTTDTDFSSDSIDAIGINLDTGATIYSLVQSGDVTYAAGNFSDSSLRNILSFKSSGNATSLSGGGLNSYVTSLLLLNDTLYAAGNFTNTGQGDVQGLNHVAAYSPSSNTWSPLGAGVNGPVTSVLSFPINSTNGTTEITVAISGSFDQILAFGSNSSIRASGFAVWVPSQNNWLQNVDNNTMAFFGQLMATADAGNNTTILAGSLVSDGITSRGAVSLTNSDGLAIQPLPVNIQEAQTSGAASKRDSVAQNVSEVLVGHFDTSNGRNLTILGGQFTAKASDGSIIQNLLFLNGSNGNTVTGLPSGVDSNSTFTTLAVYKDTLFAGGSVTGRAGSSTLNGFVTYNLSTPGFATAQPPALTGKNAVANSIAVRPSSTEIYFGGVFDAAGALPCPAVCVWDTSDGQWSRPGVGMQGSVTSLQWASDNQLIAAGNLTLGNNQTRVATYDTTSQTWSSVNGASPSEIPGEITAFGPAATDMSAYWIAGQDSNGSTFLMEYDGSKFNSAGQLFGASTTILGLQVVGLSTNHESTKLLNNDQILLITGQLVIPNFGNASAALYNGTALTPFLLSSTADGQAGTIREMFTEKQNTFSGKKSPRLSAGLVVLVSFCIALGCVFLIVALGIILNKVQRYRQGYVQAPTAYQTDRPTSMRRVPPEYLFDSIRQRQSGVPTL
ncbi:cellular morphogenesis protein (Rax2), putative [Talaromyces stipitatus ATCC 10500]|uniref:Cellular morphogenesis protein (Rax2), putative n=1 Tax=Talaromyces stipitatus (strain ATCC 10500 / CBS 375.48 / QM 6759 / NRRL 1006) TaxID=441959 RepID=B8MEU8_TALSN|nr:cellular morphogenesis protein (Rax2), putative [Talaromyces stipitatus ATCC 10500]EED16981.1 cellular morphogenesis protein (Rax2), putative [Talaromyces stipitatus ATCC 10500]